MTDRIEEIPTSKTPFEPAAEAPAGATYWRSIREYADREELAETLDQEFPGYDPDELLSMPRRQFLQFAAASMALAGLTLSGCRRWPEEQLAPYADRPEGTMPGVPERYASTIVRDGIAYGVTVLAVDGRPIKIEGNREHPWSKGKTDPFLQAQTLGLYDPARLRLPLTPKAAKREDRPSKWEAFDAFAAEHFKSQEGANSKSLAILSEPMAGPCVDAVKAEFKKRFPEAEWYSWSPLNRDNEIKGGKLAFGDKAMRPIYSLEKAQVIACFDADLIGTHPAGQQYAAGWAKGRAPAGKDDKMNRMYVVEPSFTLTGSNADVRHSCPTQQVTRLVAALAQALGVEGEGLSVDSLDDPNEQTFLKQLIEDLKANTGASAVAAGPNQPPAVHAKVYAINAKLGNIGKTVSFIQEPEATAEPVGDQIEELTRRLGNGHVRTLVILGGNPAFDAPADLVFTDAIKKADHVIRLGLYEDETSRISDWALPLAHPLTCWGDGVAYDGTVSLQQPLIHPLFNGRSSLELLAGIIAGDLPTAGYDLVRAVHRKAGLPGGPDGDQGFEKNWRYALHQGFVGGSAAKAASASPSFSQESPARPMQLGNGNFELSFRGGAVHDGSFANNGWLQELPDPLTKITWGNPLLIGYSDAVELGLNNGDMVRLTSGNAKIETPVYVMPGQAKGTLIAKLGHGRTAAGPIGGLVVPEGAPGSSIDPVGTDFYPLRNLAGQSTVGVRLEKIGGHQDLYPTTEHHQVFTDFVGNWAEKKRAGAQYDSGKIIKETTLDDFHGKLSADPHFTYSKDGAHGDVSLQLYDPPLKAKWDERAEELKAEHPQAVKDGWKVPTAFNKPHAWGMAIDMSKCTGCSACVVACQAENNIPVVGPRGVKMSREMHWLRIDTYFKPPYKDPKAISPQPDWDSPHITATHMPLTCVHCENAPCEQVCPVAATVHDTEGINTMVYNRCIGTRYCSNNCPYKVRRFNYFEWHSKPAAAGWAKPWLNFPDTQLGDKVDGIERMKFNPDVTVRMRGVMEKCTFCSQRIKRATIAAKNEWVRTQDGEHGYDRKSPMVNDGEIVTACEEACPTEAIVFGNLADPESRVSKLQSHNPRAYAVLSELNSRPRTHHMAKIRNVPKGMMPEKKEDDAH